MPMFLQFFFKYVYFLYKTESLNITRQKKQPSTATVIYILFIKIVYFLLVLF